MKIVGLVLLLLAPLGAQQEGGTPLFRTGTRLVQVDVVVRDKRGPVRGLTKDDFQVYDNGKPQQIAIFAVREAAADAPVAAREATPVKGPRVVMNRPQVTGTEPVSATVLLIDRLNTQFRDQVHAYNETLKYLKNAPPNEYIAIFSMNLTLKPVHGLTQDRDALAQALRDSWSQPKGIDADEDGEGASLPQAAFTQMQWRRDITAGAFETIATFLHGLPGRKKLVWISASIPLLYQEKRGNLVDRSLDSSKELFAAMRKLNDANTSVYPVDPVGPLRNMADESVNTMIRLADLTGGKVYRGFNDIGHGIEEAVNDTAVTYTLGFYPSDDRPEQAHSLDVKVTRDGVDLRFRKGYSTSLALRPVSAGRAQRTLDEWLQHPLDATEIPMAAVARRVANRAGNYAVEIAIDLAAVALENKNGRWRGTLDLAISPDVKGKVKGLHQVVKLSLTEDEYVGALTNGFTVINPYTAINNNGVLLSPNVHVAILDRATGRAGSVRIPLDVPPAH